MVRGLRKAYRPGIPVLEDVSFEVRRGESIALLGRSGSGKSTLLNLLAGIDEADGGSIRVCGQTLGPLDETRRTLLRRRHIGFIFQFFNLIPTLTVAENVQLKAALNQVAPRTRGPRAQALLEAVDLPDVANRFPDELSGGEQQRVAIAAALIHRPRLILADEPTGNLDLETGQKVLELLQSLSRDEGAAMVMATHSAEVLGGADHVLQMHQGRLGPRILPPSAP